MVRVHGGEPKAFQMNRDTTPLVIELTDYSDFEDYLLDTLVRLNGKLPWLVRLWDAFKRAMRTL